MVRTRTVGGHKAQVSDMTSEELESRMKPAEEANPSELKMNRVFQNQPLYTIPTKLPEELCNTFNDYFDTIKPVKGETITESKDRDVEVRWCNPSDWVGPFISSFIDQANKSLFQYDIDGVYFTECHHLTYTEGQFYNWHVDANETCWLAYQPPQHKRFTHLPSNEWTRKLSFTLQLSDPSDYEGGDVELKLMTMAGQPTTTLPKERGMFSVFDSRTLHRVLPVSKGTRKTLVGWAIGPKWK